MKKITTTVALILILSFMLVSLPEIGIVKAAEQIFIEDNFESQRALSETIYFSVEVPFPTMLVIAPIATVAVLGVGLLVYFKKRKKT